MATNLNLTIRCEGEAEVIESGEILLPSEVITEVVHDLPQEVVKFETKNENTFIECIKFKAKIKGLPGEMFPPFMEVEGEEVLVIKNEKIKDIIRKTIITTSIEKSKYELSGIFFEFKEGKLSCVATDGRRLSIYRIKENIEKISEKNINALIPGKTLQEIARILPDERDVRITVGDRKIQFKSGDVTIISNLLAENFPVYERIIPPAGDKKLVMDREAFLSAVKRAANLTSTETKMVLLNVEEGKIDITGEREESGSEGKDQIDTDYFGEKMQIRYNHVFLSDFLKVVNSDKVEIEMRDPKKPGILRALGDEEYNYVLMPMRPPDEEKSE